MRAAPLPGVKSRSLPWRALVMFSIAALATFAFAKLTSEVLEGEADALDKSIALAIHRVDQPWLDYVMIGITSLGSGIGLAIAVTVPTLWLLKHHHRRTALILACNAIAAQLVMVALKHYVRRPRPTLFDEITRPETFSFPSGHSMSAMVVYGGIAAVLVTLYPGRRGWIVAAAALLIVAIGFSRIYLGVHWPLDVVAGFIAGVPLLVAAVHLLHTKNGLKISGRDDQVNLYSSA
jgi:membrane-associated phospholipid phosphatase